MLGHAHVTTTMRYIHHRPGADDAARLSAAFRSHDTPIEMPVTGVETADETSALDERLPTP